MASSSHRQGPVPSDEHTSVHDATRSCRPSSVSSPLAHRSPSLNLHDASHHDTGSDSEGSMATDVGELEQDTLYRSHSRPVGHSMISSYRRPSVVASTPRSSLLSSFHVPGDECRTEAEFADSERDERQLLEDNFILQAPPKPKGRRVSAPAKAMRSRFREYLLARRHTDEDRHIETGDTSSFEDGDSKSDTNRLPQTRNRSRNRSKASQHGDRPSERSPLLSRDRDVENSMGTLPQKKTSIVWEEAVLAGNIQTTWQREAKTLANYSWPLVLTFMLAYSLTMASVFAVGHIGKSELAAVSIAVMSANITGYSVYQGLATSLDTLCAQAYGSGKKHLVGLQLQRMIFFLWMCTIPIAVIWWNAEKILNLIVPEKEVARLSGQYLRVLLIGTPGYSAFEAGKRYVQAQGLFRANLYVLLICAPMNIFLNWLFVWQLGWGFLGAPTAVVTTELCLPIFLFLYVYFIDGRECWGGFSRRAFHNWGPMIKLALPGLVMLLAEWLAFEILTLSSSYFSTAHLASQSIVVTLSTMTYLIPMPTSIASSTRIANLIGATLPEAAKISAKVAIYFAAITGLVNLTILSSLRFHVPKLFTDEPEVIEIVSRALPLVAASQVFDALATSCNGIMRGLGRQAFGGYVALVCYYLVGMPLSFGFGFGLGWELNGLWAGPAIALFLVFIIEAVYISRTNWDKSVEAALHRNSML